MKKQVMSLIILATLLVAVTVIYSTVSKEGVTPSKDNETSLDNNRGMMNQNNNPHAGHMMDMMVSSEQDFIEKMIPHHQEAINTAKEVVERGGTTLEVKELVENIIIAQEAEVMEMKEWYAAWYGKEYVDDGQYQDMMRDLEGLSGVDIDVVFLQDMIMHHMGAIMMARSVQPYIEHEEINNLTAVIIMTQSQEIQQMEQMLGAF